MSPGSQAQGTGVPHSPNRQSGRPFVRTAQIPISAQISTSGRVSFTASELESESGTVTMKAVGARDGALDAALDGATLPLVLRTVAGGAGY